MPREELQAASDALRRAAESVDDSDVEQRVYDRSRELAQLATAERGPDHGHLARLTRALQEVLDDAEDEETRTHVDHAIEQVRAYRETVEGV